MGFDTYIDVGDRTVVQYRKQTGGLPRFLFNRADLELDLHAGSDSPPAAVSFESTAEEVLAVLDEQGLGWDGSVAAYATVRSGQVAEAFLSGQYIAKLWKATSTGEELDEEIERRLAIQRAASPEEDLIALGSLLANQWLDLSNHNVLLFGQLRYDEPFEVSGSMIGAAIRSAEAAGTTPLPTARAAETLALLFREARLIAWPMLLSILLRHLPGDTPVRYVLTEGISEFELDDEDAALKFVDDYWATTGASIADYARNLGVLFGSLAAFETRLGPQYWFGQASTALSRLETMNLNRKKSSSKERGDALERLVECLLMTETPDLTVTEKNFSTKEEEIDLVLRNNLANPFWIAQQSPFIFVECKNWEKPVGVAELRVFESKLDDRGGAVRVGLFVSVSGFYSTFVDRLKTIQTKNIGLVYAISLEDIRGLINRRERLSDWLLGSGSMRAFDAHAVDD